MAEAVVVVFAAVWMIGIAAVLWGKERRLQMLEHEQAALLRTLNLAPSLADTEVSRRFSKMES